jgi:hypothetical protein
MRLTGLQIQELRDIILQAFPNEGELAQELLFKLDISYQNLSEGGNYKARVTNIITEYFEVGNTHTTPELLDALITVRPRNDALKNFKNTYYQERPKKADILSINITSNTVSFKYKDTDYKSPNQLADPQFVQELLALTSPQQYGEKLFEAIFNNKPLAAVGGHRTTIAGFGNLDSSGLIKIELVIDAGDIGLHEYNWELLRDANSGLWLSVQISRPFYRRHGDVRKNAIASKPLKILVVICNPRSNQNTIIESLPAIDIQKEKATLQSIFDPLVTKNIVEYDILERGTWRNLKQALLEEKYHVVHFIAHGAYINKEFCLIMDGDNINEWFITKDRFDQDLRSNPLQLFVLISCEGGTFNENLSTKGLGPILVEKGIPYVIAMQKPISFYAAERFSKLFYENLTKPGSGSIDKAMARTRSDLKEDSQLKLAEWAIPVLFMATNEAELLKT